MAPANQLLILWLATGLATAPSAIAAPPPQHMSFRNNLLPGHVTVHRISRTVRRKATRRKYVETLRYRQRADWVQCNIDQPEPGNVMTYQMMVDHPARVLSVRHGKKKITPTPSASGFTLPEGSTRLHSAYKTPWDGPAQTPLANPVQRAVMHALLDFAHWPKKRIDAGHRWERDIRGNGIRGTQTLEFVDLAKSKGDVVARLTLLVEGEFEDSLAKDYVFGKGQAVIYWSRPERTLVKMEAQADYRRKRHPTWEEFKIELDVKLVDLDAFDEDDQARVTNQMIAFSDALKHQREGDDREARKLCRQYRETWPGSLWLPAVDELEQRTLKKRTESKRFSAKELNDLLVKTVLAHDAARTNLEYDLLERMHRGLETLAREYRLKLKKLAKDDHEGRRSRAVFALAFSHRPKDLEFVQKAARDESPKVRAMALAGLAARRHPGTSAELLIDALADEKSAVRRRACQAIAACLAPNHYSVVRAVDALDRLMIHDKSTGVRLEAVLALATLGAPVDVPKLEKALTHEVDREIREELHKAIETLRSKGD